jgi:hypothetical protein
MTFKSVLNQEPLDSLRGNPLHLGYLDGIFPVLIDTELKAAFSVGPNYTKGHRILGEEYWNSYDEETLIHQVISSAQLSGNFKWFISTMRTRLINIQNPPVRLNIPIV